ncbi:MAG: hypothetical protein H0Z35_10615 [Thermoanaerobacteraceae bacterium]|nr:hypothetical protein [Thermoanaerobacteraceae bacterium]
MKRLFNHIVVTAIVFSILVTGMPLTAIAQPTSQNLHDLLLNSIAYYKVEVVDSNTSDTETLQKLEIENLKKKF